MPETPTIQFALGVGAAGARVDVSSYVEFGEPIAKSMGKQDQFRDAEPGTFRITLNNRDGRFTPDNASSPYATTVTEGMAATLSVGGRLTDATVQSIELPGTEADWGQITLVCEDMLGSAARRQLGASLPESMALGSPAYLYWPFDDSVTSGFAAEKSGNAQPAIGYFYSPASMTFGVQGLPVLGGATQATVSGNGSFSSSITTNSPFTPITYPAGSLGSWGFWFTPSSASTSAGLQVVWNNGVALTLGTNNSGRYSVFGNSGSPLLSALSAVPGESHYLSLSTTYSPSGGGTATSTFYIDGVSQGSIAWSFPIPAVLTILTVSVYAGISSTPGNMNIAQLSHTPTRLSAELALAGTKIADRLVALDQTAAEVALDTLPSDLSTAPVGLQPSGGSLLDNFSEVMRTEQGYIYTATSGTLTSPTQLVKVRARTRPATVSYTFDAQTELSDVPQFIRDVTNLASKVTVSGPTQSVLYADPTINPRVGSANIDETVLSTEYVDLLAFAQDRSNRGKNLNLRVVSVKIDSLTTPTSRLADLLAMVPGDRIQVSNIPSTTLGFSSWDGWLLGVKERHRGGRDSMAEFELFLAPVLPATAVYDTNLWMGDTALTLSFGISASATSMFVATSIATTLLETAAFPYTILIDSEQMTVTACTAGTPQVATVVRGVNGTTAAAHAGGALVEVTPASLYAF